MKPYPLSKSNAARFAQWTVTYRDGRVTVGCALLSFTKPRRALWRLIAHLEKEVPTAARYDACFPTDDIYCGLEGESE